MSRPDSPLRNNLTDEETIKKLKLMLIKEKRKNKENLKVVNDLNNSIELKTKENTQLIHQIQRLSENIGCMEDHESDNIEVIQKCKKEIFNLNKKCEEMRQLVTEKDEVIDSHNKNLRMLFEKFQKPQNNYKEFEFIDIVSMLESKLLCFNENAKFDEVVEENRKLKEQIINLNQLHEDNFNIMKTENNNLILEMNRFKTKICDIINEKINLNETIFPNLCLKEDDTLISISNDIDSCLKNVIFSLKNQIESNYVLQDGIDKMVLKCNDLENVIENQKEQLLSLKSYYKEFHKLQIDSDQKDEKIKRLEGLIEENRNISRALETERDQLQNDLVDLHQRHEEKEGYLMEEYREAKQNLESFRIFNDDETVSNLTEIQKLKTLLNQYQHKINEDRYINNCNFCQEFELLMKTLKQKLGIVDESLNHEKVIENVIEKFSIQRDTFDSKIDYFMENQRSCEGQLHQMKSRLTVIEKIIDHNETIMKEMDHLRFTCNDNEKLIDTLKQYINEKDIVINKINLKTSDLSDSYAIILKDNEYLKEILNKLKDIFNIDINDDIDGITDFVKKLLSDSEVFKEEIEEYKSKLEDYKEKYRYLQMEHEDLSERMCEVKKSSPANDLISLEMAEFDKTLVNLNNQVLNKSNQLEELKQVVKSKESMVNKFQEQITEKETQNSFLEERNHKMKQLLVKTKRELADCKSELENLKITDRNTNEQNELLTNQLEENKFQLSEMFKEKEKLMENFNTASKKFETMRKNKNLRIIDLKSQLDVLMRNNQSLMEEFESYKIKAQNALSAQQKSKSTFTNFMSVDSPDSIYLEDSNRVASKDQLIDLELIIKDLKIDLQENEDKSTLLNNELDGLRLENQKLIEKYKLLIKEHNDLNLKFQQTVLESQESDTFQKASYNRMIEQFEMEKENTIKKHSKELESCKINHRKEIADLEQKVLEAENENVKCQEEIWDYREQLRNDEYKMGQVNVSLDNQQIPQKNQIFLSEHERQQGEGMETTNELSDSNLTSQLFSPRITIPKRSFQNVPLDKLLNVVDDATTKLMEDQLVAVTSQSQSYKKKIQHLTELLNDSEASVSRLTDQATVLKSEIRRLEKNRDRDSKLIDEPTNEYLKNVIMKFLDYETKLDERNHLVPVLVTLLSLDSTEKEKLTLFSRLLQFDKRHNVDSWSSYFNWAGIS